MDTLLTIGGFTPLPYIFYSVIQTARQHGRINFFGALLALAAALIPIGLVGWMSVTGTSDPVFTVAAIANAAIVLLFSILIAVRDARQPSPGLNHSYGPLGLGVGVLVIAAVLLIPIALPLVAGTTAAADTASADTTAQQQVFPAFAAPNNNTETAADASAVDGAADTALAVDTAAFAPGRPALRCRAPMRPRLMTRRWMPPWPIRPPTRMARWLRPPVSHCRRSIPPPRRRSRPPRPSPRSHLKQPPPRPTTAHATPMRISRRRCSRASAPNRRPSRRWRRPAWPESRPMMRPPATRFPPPM
ncbi:MAG: hypothetical protein IPK19_38470 [Chloroflexi bacterium]|nr:hypothetical protein [Chloroflexota bacterium]